MRKMKKLAAITLIAAIGTTVLTGCSQEDNSASNPVKSNQSDYSESYVQLKDGRTVLCLARNAGTYAATMSCDFNSPIKK